MRTYRHIEIQLPEEDATPLGQYYLILVSKAHGSEFYILSTEPGRGNQTNAVKLHGWLGTTNDVARYAEGCVELYRDAQGRLRIRPCPDIIPEEMGDAP